MAWHELLGLAQAEGKGKHGRQASQQLTPVGIKRERRESKHRVKAKALDGLRQMYGPQAQPRSEGQAAALQLVHEPPATSIIVLPTSSGKSVLFFSVAAMAVDQTVVVVVPFTALVEDIVARGQAAGLQCREWSYSNHYSSQELAQLLVVSADEAVSGQFLHEAKGYELRGQLAHMFFDECHVAFTDTSYRERLRELWKLRYLKCPFTALTATLIVELEDVLRERLLIEDAVLLRRSTARPTIRYQVQDSKEEAACTVGLRLLERLLYLPDGKRGVVYVRSYATGELISSALECSFYKARADDKGQTLQKWAQGSGGWIVATGALGTGINIPGIIYVVHIDRPYGLTSFAQQSGRGGREGEVSESIIITQVQSVGVKSQGLMSEYSVEQVDEDAMTEYMQSRECRRVVLGRYFDGVVEGVSCVETESVLCDLCLSQVAVRKRGEEGREEAITIKVTIKEGSRDDGRESKGGRIQSKMKEVEEEEEQMRGVMNRLKRGCIYCELEYGGIRSSRQVEVHEYVDCIEAEREGCGIARYEEWRGGVDIRGLGQCEECGLSVKVCRRWEGGVVRMAEERCEYGGVMLVGIFILFQQGYLQGVAEVGGFQGRYPEEI